MEMPINPVNPVPSGNVYVSQPGRNKLFSKRNILVMIFLLVVVIALPVGVYLVQKTQILKSKAAGGYARAFRFTPVGTVTLIDSGNSNSLAYNTTTEDEITLNIDADGIKALLPDFVDTSPGPNPAGTPTSTPTPTPTPTIAPTATTAPSPQPKPSILTGLEATCVSSTQVRLFWNPVPAEAVNGYWYWIEGITDGYVSSSNPPEIITITADKPYEWSVVAKGATQAGDPAKGNFQCPKPSS